MGLLSFLGFGGSNAVPNSINAINKVASAWIQNAADREKETNYLVSTFTSDIQSAREEGAAQAGDSGLSAFADGINKMIRPILAVGTIGLFCHWWPGPDVTHEPEYIKWAMGAVFGFYFGVMSIANELPAGIGKFIKIIKG